MVYKPTFTYLGGPCILPHDMELEMEVSNVQSGTSRTKRATPGDANILRHPKILSHTIWLVVWLPFFIFHIYGIIIPID